MNTLSRVAACFALMASSPAMAQSVELLATTPVEDAKPDRAYLASFLEMYPDAVGLDLLFRRDKRNTFILQVIKPVENAGYPAASYATLYLSDPTIYAYTVRERADGKLRFDLTDPAGVKDTMRTAFCLGTEEGRKAFRDNVERLFANRVSAQTCEGGQLRPRV